jgi:hypothetical protein
MGTNTPASDSDLFPIEMHEVALTQATPFSSLLEPSVCTVPGTPLLMGTTTPFAPEELLPTATHKVVLAQATAFNASESLTT